VEEFENVIGLNITVGCC